MYLCCNFHLFDTLLGPALTMFSIRGQIVLPSIAQNYWQLFTLEPARPRLSKFEPNLNLHVLHKPVLECFGEEVCLILVWNKFFIYQSQSMLICFYTSDPNLFLVFL